MNWYLLNLRPVKPESKQEKNLNAKKLPIEYGSKVNLNALTIFKKSSILDVWLGSEYASHVLIVVETLLYMLKNIFIHINLPFNPLTFPSQELSLITMEDFKVPCNSNRNSDKC